MCRITLLSTPISSQTCAAKSSGSRRKWQSSRAGSSTRSGLTSATSRVRTFSPDLLFTTSENLPVKQTLSHWCALLSPAEVQAHSGQQTRAETEQLREQLLEAFRQQMVIRRSLLELENSSMEVQIDTSRHLLTIAESVFRMILKVHQMFTRL